jgi:hypothetical protein
MDVVLLKPFTYRLPLSSNESEEEQKLGELGHHDPDYSN